MLVHEILHKIIGYFVYEPLAMYMILIQKQFSNIRNINDIVPALLRLYIKFKTLRYCGQWRGTGPLKCLPRALVYHEISIQFKCGMLYCGFTVSSQRTIWPINLFFQGGGGKFPLFCFFSKFIWILKSHISYWTIHSYLTGVTAAQLQWHLSNSQIWMWLKEFNRCFFKIKNFAYREINKQSLSNPHPRFVPLNKTAAPVPVKWSQGIRMRSNLNKTQPSICAGCTLFVTIATLTGWKGRTASYYEVVMAFWHGY